MSRFPFKLTAALPMLAIFAAAPLPGQEIPAGETRQKLLDCDGLADPTEKLACFDAVVESLKSDTAEAPAGETPPAPAAVPEPEPEAPQEARIPPDAPGPAPEAPPPTPVPEAAAESATPREARDRDEDGDEAGDTIRATIVRATLNYNGHFIVELDNGQTWRETQGTKVGLPEAGSSVEITTGFFGGRRMKIENIPRVAWVRQAD